MEKSSTKADRLLKIEALLLSHPDGLTPSEIARRLGVHRSTIGRYMPDLPGHIYIDDLDGNRWKIDREDYLINVRLSLHEALTLHLAARLMATRSDKQNPHAAAALRKLGISMNRLAPRISQHLQLSADAMDDDALRFDPAYLQVLEKLTLAWAEERKVRVWHRHEPSGQVHDYAFAPYFIDQYAVGRTAHVIGWREPPGALRTFKIERIERIELLRESYKIPSDFDPRDLLADAWGIWYTEAEPVDVELRFHPRVVQRVLETRWHRSQQVEGQSDGSLLWRAQVAEPQEMLPWIRGWGADVEVVEPGGLRERLRAEARRLARLYSATSTPEDPHLACLLRCWGKTPRNLKDEREYHPALFHMLDVGYVARSLLGEQASPRMRNVLARQLGMDNEGLVDWLPWLISLHDIGKVSATFQRSNEYQEKRLASEGFDFGEWKTRHDLHHSLVSQTFFNHELETFPDFLQNALADVMGGHHGQFVHPREQREAQQRIRAHEPANWRELRQATADILKQHLAPQLPGRWPKPANISTTIMALTGFTILCDWLGSDERYFRIRPEATLEEYMEESARNARRAVENAGFFQNSCSTAPTDFAALFPDKHPPRPLQEAIDAIPAALLSRPCLAIIEAPTGEGKTEAAFALARRLAHTHGSDELYCALPTTATSNQMFGRLQQHLHERLGLETDVKLVHGQAFLVEDDLRLQLLGSGDGSDARAALEWFSGKKRALLAPFGVGTVDQAELAALNVRHNALRMIGLAGKVVIIDEVHAYDTYMTTIVERLLEWLAALGTSVILLSATLPKSRRSRLVRAYGGGDEALENPDAYPSLWVVGARGQHHANPPAYQPKRILEIHKLHYHEDQSEEKARWLVDAAVNSGCVCWITNTVRRAQDLYTQVVKLADQDVDILLLHSQFPLEERQQLEVLLGRKYGPDGKDRPRRGIVIGTQVLEQSLDLDFDLLVSDLAPIDLLLQRAGRLHRHDRERPAAHAIPRLFINVPRNEAGGLALGVDSYIYAEFFLRQTWDVLAAREKITLPEEYRPLIEDVYGEVDISSDTPLAEAWNDLQTRESNALGKARQRLLPEPDPDYAFTPQASRMVFDENESSTAWSVAQTRLGRESLTVIPLERQGNHAIVLPGEDPLDLNAPASHEIQLRLRRREMRVSNYYLVQALKDAKEPLTKLFAESPLLKDMYPLWLTDGQARFPIKKGKLGVTLHPKLGLVTRKEGE